MPQARRPPPNQTGETDLPASALPEAPSAESPDVALRLDCTALKCPLPVLRLAVAIKDVAVGEVVAVAADDPAARTDIPAWCRMRGHAFLGLEEEPGQTANYLIRRNT